MKLKLYPKILKNLFTLGLGLLLAFPSLAQVVEAVPDSTFQILTQVADTDTVKQKPDQEFLDEPVHYPARDSIIFSYSDNKIKMYGEASVEYKDKLIKAEYIEMTMDKKEIFARGVEDSSGQVIGIPNFKDGEETYDCKTLRYNFDTGRARVTDVVTTMDEGGGTSFLHSHITKTDTIGNLHIKDAKFTTCDDPDHPHFYFAITKGIMTKKKSVVSGPAYLVVADIPLYFLGLPFGFFPKQEKKASGILMPKVGEEVRRGFYLRDFGYYFAGTEKFDLKLRGDVYSKGSWKGSVDSHYKKRYKFNGNLGFTYAKNYFGERDIDGQPGSIDYSIRWSHSQDPKAHPYRNFSANVNFSNSSFEQNNTYETEQRMTSTKSSSISFSRKFPNKLFNFTSKIGATQNSQNNMVTLNLPSGAFTVGRFYPFKRKTRVGKQKWYEKIDMRYSSNFENSVRSPDSTLFQADIVNRMENGFKHEVPVQASFKLIPNMTLTPSLRYQGLLYFYHIEKEWDDVNETLIVNRVNKLQYVQSLVPNVSLSYSPKISGFYESRKENGPILRHVASPSLSFNYRPDVGFDESKYYDSVQQSINGYETRYSIFDDSPYRLPSIAGRSGNISFRLGNNLEMKMLDKADTTGQTKKVKILDDLNLSTGYDIFKDSLNLSPFALSARTRVLDSKINITFNSTLDPYSFGYDSSRSVDNPSPYTSNTFLIASSGKLLRLTRANLSMGFTLPFKKKPPGGTGNTDDLGYDDYWAYKMPWRLNVSYSLRYSKPYDISKLTQSVNLSGDFSLTPKWGFKLSTGYDFVDKRITNPRIDVTRDLHCWVMTFNVIPLGRYKSYTFQINVKSAMFKDVKYRKEKHFYDSYY